MTNTNTQTTDLPAGWMTTTLDKILIESKTRYKPNPNDHHIEYIGLEHIEKDTGKLLGKGAASDVVSTKNVFEKGDLLYGKLRPYLNKVTVAGSNGVCSTDILVFKKHSNSCNELLKFRLLSRDFVTFAQRNISGVQHPRVNVKKIGKFPINLPPLPEQHRIVAKIEEMFSDLDHSVAALEKAREQFKTYRQAVLKYAFEGKLTAEWRQAHSPPPATDLPPLTEAELAELPSLPEGWIWVKAEALSKFITKGTTPKKGELFSNSGEIPFIKVYNLTHTGTLDFSVNPTFTSIETHKGFLARSIVFPGDILMNIVGPPLGKVSLVPDTYSEWNINQAIVRYRPRDILLNKYLKHFLLSEVTIRGMMRKSKATAGQFNLTLEICRDLLVPLCSVPEQHAIIEEIESRLSVVDKLEETIEASLQQAEALRQSILKQAFTGKLVPQDPNDEPADKLLERIKNSNSHIQAAQLSMNL